ncbi:hypothetical protein GCM10011492_11300 [Flexivirga endophytica]|uniref:Secreted protein n=1 Tax=Flexivirga endophytica TaxID=1849103 RepID=A0A916SYL8_9MICO|nr:hypothetical protein [Flexivirga endophytica]GGB23179.1 hypothetical protein GCM10011492_11300 [Flexivirga endophytica]GHB57103.1 hypothetical protein GCM10008112_27840 [Flexivirga endophytica]
MAPAFVCCLAGSGTPGAPAAVSLVVGFALVVGDVAALDVLVVFVVCGGAGSPEAMPGLECVEPDDDAPSLDPPPHPDAARTASSVAVAPTARELRIG